MAKILKVGIVLFAILLFSFRLKEVPPGLTIDEAAFGYNATLLAETGYDQNGKHWPFFVLSIDGKDWRQPVTQYATTIFFKLFGASMFNLRFVSVLVAVSSLIIIMSLTKKLWGSSVSAISALIFVTTPIVYIHSHMGLDNIMPIPFVAGWMLCMYKFQKTRDKRYAIIAGVLLGISFYSYKAMRLIVPVLSVLTLTYLGPYMFYFIVGVFPFLVIIPILRQIYPGALGGGFNLYSLTWDEFFYPYLSTFDPTFLFIKGDSTVYHSTGIHGMFLLATLPLFLVGIYKTFKSRDKFLLLITTSFFFSSLGFGLVNSAHRASRLLAIVPFYVVISTLGVVALKRRKTILMVVITFIILNFISFGQYYWYEYPKFAKSYFSQTHEDNYKTLASTAKEMNLTPLIDSDLYKSDGEVAYFYEAAYFDEKLIQFSSDDKLGEGQVLMTYRENLDGVRKIRDLPNYKLYVKE